MTIEDWREEIDATDDELLRLLNRRAQLAIEVGALKRAAGLPLCDATRERAIVARLCCANAGPLNNKAVAELFRLIIRESRRVEAGIFETDAAKSTAAQQLAEIRR